MYFVNIKQLHYVCNIELRTGPLVKFVLYVDVIGENKLFIKQESFQDLIALIELKTVIREQKLSNISTMTI